MNGIIKKIFGFLLIVILGIAIVGCSNNKTPTEEDEDKIKMLNVDTIEMGTNIILENNIDNENAIWTSSDEKIARIEDRVIYGIDKGSCTITCQIGEKLNTFVFNVTYPKIRININGSNTVYVGEKINLEAVLSKETSERVNWASSDEGIASVTSTGVVKGVSVGEVKITASVYDNVAEFIVKVSSRESGKPEIVITGESLVKMGKEIKLDISVVGESNAKYKVSSSDETVATITENGLVAGIKGGVVVITVWLVDHPEVVSRFQIEVIDIRARIELEGEESIMQGKLNYLIASFKGEGVDNISHEIEWNTSDPKVAIVSDGVVLAVNKGEVTITATSKENKNLSCDFDMTVTKFEDKTEVSEETEKRINDLIASLSLEQKIGQMFIVGFSGTSFSSGLSSAISEYHFGNVIYMGANVSNPSTILNMSNDIQRKMVECNNGIPAIISTDQEGGNVARLKTKATHFVSNMATCATGNPENSYEIGKATGFELNCYGINMDLAPVLDVNNNPANPIIGIRSYSDNPINVAIYGSKMYQGLEASGVVGCVKHFPGHGNTATDSHTGLPVINTSKDELYQTELAPFICAISNGVGAIMTTHILFTAIDNTFPATLSKKVLTDLLRDELGYTGLIITDGMQMAGVSKNYGGYDEVAVKAVQAGVDILTYTSTDAPKTAYSGILNAVNNGTISVDRINESVRRILLAKIRYGIMDDYIKEEKNIDAELAKNSELNYKIGREAITVIKGDFKLDKTKSTLFISVACNSGVDKVNGVLESNSLACYSATYLKSKGYINCDYYTTSNPIKSNEYDLLLERIKNYDQVVVGFSNTKTSNETISMNFMNEVAKLKGDKLLCVALNNPYDILGYTGVSNYVCLYTNQNVTIVGFAKWLNGEFEATGKSPIDENLFK